MDVDIKTGTIFYKTQQAFEDGNKIIVHRGGTGSGKTYDIVLFLFSIALRFKDLIITIVSESKPHLDIGAIRILSNVCKPLGLWGKTSWNISTSRWTAPSGSIIEFFSADRIDKALGARRDYLYGNEVNSLKKDVWDELARRSENVIADFNPTAQFWMENWLSNYDKTVVIKSNYTDNPFLPETERNRIEMRVSRDENFKRIHFDCEYGVTEGIIFSNWYQIDRIPQELEEKAIYGLDFGFTNDPSALIKTIEVGDAFYVDELIYQTGMLNSDIIRRFDSLGLKKNYDEIIADSAEPKSIQEMCNAGYNVKGAVKGPDSIIKGIDTLLSKPIYVTKRSVNLIKELRAYSWALNKDGNPTNKPIDAYNHCFVGETMITTDNGEKRIDKIRVGDFVATSNGYKKVINIFNNGCKKILYIKIKFSTFTVELKATPEHKIKTVEGWKKLKDLKAGDRLFTRAKNLMEKPITYTQEKSIILEDAIECMSLYGSSIMGKGQKVTIFITLMGILKTIASKTLNVFMGVNTCQTMQNSSWKMISMLKNCVRGWIMLVCSQINGMVLRMGGNGTQSMQLRLQPIYSQRTIFVKSVEYPTKARVEGASVLINVRQRAGEIQELTMNRGFASNVEKHSFAINMQKENFAVENVVEEISLVSVGKDNVYDIEVDDMHEYFANGILVHNCIDASRYAVMHKINKFEFSIY